MEDLLGVQQREIGCQCCNMNLLKETMGKMGQLGEDGTVRYPINVSYNMDWQKATKTYDSLSGHGLMIGNATKNVIAFQNFSSACGFCDHHLKIAAKTLVKSDTTNATNASVFVPTTNVQRASYPGPLLPKTLQRKLQRNGSKSSA
jgi:hypothetical protein